MIDEENEKEIPGLLQKGATLFNFDWHIGGINQTLYEKGGFTMDYFYPVKVFEVVMICTCLDDARFWKWLKNKFH